MILTKKKKQLLAAAILAVAVVAMGLFYLWQRPVGQAGEKTLAVAVLYDGQQKDFTIKTAQEFLGAALSDNGLIEGENGPYGLYITVVDGREADGAKNEWWCITRDGQMLDTGADSTPIADGEHYELTLSVY